MSNLEDLRDYATYVAEETGLTITVAEAQIAGEWVEVPQDQMFQIVVKGDERTLGQLVGPLAGMFVLTGVRMGAVAARTKQRSPEEVGE